MSLLLAQVPVPAEELADIRDPVNFVPWLIVGAVVLALLLLAGLAAWLWRLRARRREAAPVVPEIPPALWARGEFDRIAATSASLDDKAFTSAVADVLRAYLERAFAVPAPERTTEEFLQLIGEHAVFAGPLRATLDTFLRRSDLVKFARQPLDARQREPMLEEARAVVEEAELLRTPPPAQGAPAAPAPLGTTGGPAA
jgi:hypothetical protein